MILVTGATGYIGSRLVRRLVRDGHSVRAMVLKGDPLLKLLEGVPCEIVLGDITDRQSLAPCFKDVRTVFHLAAVMVSHNPALFHRINYEGTRNVVDAAVEAGVGHFVYLSAAAAAYKTRTQYGNSKIQAEGLMREKGQTRFTIIRPTLLYGAGGSEELRMYVRALRKFPFVVPLVGCGRARKRPVWVEDIVKGLSLLVDQPVSHGKTYNFGGGTELSMREYTRLICRTFGISKPMLPVPAWFCYAVAGVWSLFAKQPILRRDTILGVTMDAIGDIGPAAREIGYRPVAVEEGYRRGFAGPEDRF